MIVNTLTPMTDAERTSIGERLKSRGANAPCPRCNNKLFFVVDNVALPFMPNLPHLSPSVNAALTAILTSCTNCGFIALHALDLIQHDR
jgi:hypothetical protein